jgi:hypothetical protein
MIRALIDSRATGNFISPRTVRIHGWHTEVIDRPYTLQLADSQETSAGQVKTQTVSLPITAVYGGNHHERI